MIWHKRLESDGDHADRDPLAAAAVDAVKHGMLVGLGAGKTASRAVRELARRVRDGELTEIGVAPASDAAEALCLELGLAVTESSRFETIDVLIDGADEVDREMRMLKGSRGAVTRERILARAAERRLYLVPESKLSESLGTSSALAIALLPFGVASTRRELRRLGINGVLRPEIGGGLLVTDNANLILDAHLPQDADLERLAADINAVPGVVEHGIFLDEADELLVERDDGAIERLSRRG